MPDIMFDGLVGTKVNGYVEGIGSPDGVRFNINLTGLPDATEYGPFPYHIRNLPVPADGNCTSTLGHLDPTNRGELHMCDTSAPQTCQVGDLAGKHGKITAQSAIQTSYTDAYLSTDPSSPNFFGGLSVVLHTRNTTRITCANFVQMGGGNGTMANGTATMSMSMPSGTSTGTPAEYTGATATAKISVRTLGAAVAVIVCFVF